MRAFIWGLIFGVLAVGRAIGTSPADTPPCTSDPDMPFEPCSPI